MKPDSLKTRVLFSSNLKKADETDFEVVERKGIGHPDTLADGIAEVISNEYSKYCLKNFGAILHHNLDKISLIGGLVDIDFGKGKMIKPAKLILNGRMSVSFGSKKINIANFQNLLAKEYLKRVLPNLNINKGIKILNYTNSYSHNPYWYHPRSLKDIPDRENPHANDTSATVGYWPLSKIETLVLQLEKFFYEGRYKPKFDYIGQDIKLMAVRKGRKVNITACIPFISTKTPTRAFYDKKINSIQKNLEAVAAKKLPKNYKIEINVNTADKSGDIYLLLTGSCVEAGEEGVVGRGNKSRGVISSIRPHSMEASCGKNPVYHIGKIYAVIADSLSRSISEMFNCECNVFVTTKIRDNLYNPNNIIVETSNKINIKKALNIIENHLSFRGWTSKIVGGGLLVPMPGRGNNYRLAK